MQISTKLIYMEYIENDNRVPYSLQMAVITVGIISIHLSYFLNDRVTTSNDVDLPSVATAQLGLLAARLRR